MGDSVGDLLVIVIDLHPVWWANHSLTEVVQCSLVLSNAHLLQNPLNKVSYNPDLCAILFSFITESLDCNNQLMN